jgi:Domain of unknown function (DUF4157)
MFDDTSARTLTNQILGLQHALGNHAVQRLIEEALRSPGQPLDDRSRSLMENTFGRDFTHVRIHVDTKSAEAAAALKAEAFAFGSDIVLGGGCPDTDTYEGRKLLAHELTHVVQQEFSAATVFSNIGDLAAAAESEAESVGELAAIGKSVEPRVATGIMIAPDVREPEPPELKTKLDAIAATYRAMIANARKDGKNVAADNLQRFLDGSGGVKKMDVTWLRSFEEVAQAEKINRERFEGPLTKAGKGVQHADKKTFEDYWDRLIQSSVFTELYYASGTSTLHSTGQFSLEGIENIVNISGHVNHHWYDPYDWHEGLSAYIPGFGNVSDADALLLQKYRGAKPFQMEADWTQYLNGKLTHRGWWFDSADYSWTGP